MLFNELLKMRRWWVWRGGMLGCHHNAGIGAEAGMIVNGGWRVMRATALSSDYPSTRHPLSSGQQL